MAQASSFGGLPTETAQQIIGYLANEKPFFSSLFQFLRCGFSVLTPESTQGDNADECLKGPYALSRFVARYWLASRVRGLTFFFPLETDIGGHYLHDFRFKLLAFALGEINSERLTLIAPPAVLGKIGHLHVNENDTWAFGKKIHVLSLRQPRELAGPSANTRRIPASPGPGDGLCGLRPWNEFTINEGSCMETYFGCYDKTTPSIIGGWGLPRPLSLEKTTLLPHVTNFEYVGVNPLPNHILRCLPSLVSLVTQFTQAGSARRDTHEDEENISDLWMMAATLAYEALARDLMIWSGRTNFWEWRSTDDWIAFDEIVGPIMVGWEMRKPLLWKRVDVEGDDQGGRRMEAT
ncbi:MAG: hypothetical protein Q9207_006024 [Kuettlingeria erythrocarpa]